MRTGDAESEIWLETDAERGTGRSYCLTIRSRRLGRRGSDRWQHPIFLWWCEQWGTERPAPSSVRKSRSWSSLEEDHRLMARTKGECDTYQDAERCARRAADALELEARK